MKKIIALIFCAIALGSAAQNMKSDFRKMNQALLSKPNWNIVMTKSAHKNDPDGPLISSETITIQKKADNYCFKRAGSDFVITGHYLIGINHPSKELFVSKRNPEDYKLKLQDYTGFIDAGFDSILTIYKKVDFTKDKNTGVYTVYLKGETVEKARIAFDLNTFMIKQIDYWFKNLSPDAKKSKERMVASIKYESYEFNPKLSAADFSDINFFTTDARGKIKPSQKFKSYKLLNVNEPDYD